MYVCRMEKNFIVSTSFEKKKITTMMTMATNWETNDESLFENYLMNRTRRAAPQTSVRIRKNALVRCCYLLAFFIRVL